MADQGAFLPSDTLTEDVTACPFSVLFKSGIETITFRAYGEGMVVLMAVLSAYMAANSAAAAEQSKQAGVGGDACGALTAAHDMPVVLWRRWAAGVFCGFGLLFGCACACTVLQATRQFTTPTVPEPCDHCRAAASLWMWMGRRRMGLQLAQVRFIAAHLRSHACQALHGLVNELQAWPAFPCVALVTEDVVELC